MEDSKDTLPQRQTIETGDRTKGSSQDLGKVALEAAQPDGQYTKKRKDSLDGVDIEDLMQPTHVDQNAARLAAAEQELFFLACQLLTFPIGELKLKFELKNNVSS